MPKTVDEANALLEPHQMKMKCMSKGKKAAKNQGNDKQQKQMAVTTLQQDFPGCICCKCARGRAARKNWKTK